MHKKAVALARMITGAFYELADVNLERQAQEGLVYLRKALELDPHNPGRVWQTMTIAEFCLGNYEKAVALGERAREFNPTTTSIGGVLSLPYAKLGQLQRAARGFRALQKGVVERHLPPTIPLVMMFYNFSDPKISEAVVESMVKAGLPLPHPTITRLRCSKDSRRTKSRTALGQYNFGIGLTRANNGGGK